MIPKLTTIFSATFLWACLAFGATGASAQSYAPPSTNWVVDADELIRIALTNNLNIMLSRLQPDIDQYNLQGLYGAYEPSLNLNVTHNYNAFPSGVFTQTGQAFPGGSDQINSYTPAFAGASPLGTTYNLSGPFQEQNFAGAPDIYNASPSIQLTQPLLKNFWLNNPRYQIQFAKSTLRIDQQALLLQIMTVVNSIKAAYYTLISDRQLVTVQEIAVKLAEETWHEDEARVRAGALAPLDEKQAESQAASARSDLFTAQTALAAEENVVKGLLGVRRGDWTGSAPIPVDRSLIAVPENPDVRECWRVAFDRRPDMLQAKLKAEQQKLTMKFDFNQLFPELDLVGSYGRTASDLTYQNSFNTIRAGSYPFYSYGVSMTIPLGNTTARNKYKADKAGLQQFVLQIKQLELTIIPTVDNDVTKLRTDLLKVDSTRQARMYAEDALEAEQTRLKHGKSTSFVVLTLQNTLTQARSAEIQALANYNIDLDQLAFDEGTILERNHIDVRLK